MENSYRFFENRECRYFPCHKKMESFNCLFCYCPLYNIKKCPGNPSFIKKGDKEIKVCTNCTFPHVPEHYDKIMEILKNINSNS